MNAYLQNIVNKIADQDLHDREFRKYKDSSKTTSWKAMREGENITDKSYIEELEQYVVREKNTEKRDAAYFLLIRIAGNVKDNSVTNFLIERLKVEDDDIIISIQDGISFYLNIPSETNIQSIINNTLSKKWQMRHSAIRALGSAYNNTVAEDWLIKLSQKCNDEFDMLYISVALANIGTTKSLPTLYKALHHSKQDVKAAAFAGIERIERKSALPFYIEQLKKGKVKPAAIEAIYKYGDERAIHAVIDRVKEQLSRKRSYMIINYKKDFSDLMLAMDFLKKYAEKQEIKNLYQWIAEKKIDQLFPEEKNWFQTQSKYFK